MKRKLMLLYAFLFIIIFIILGIVFDTLTEQNVIGVESFESNLILYFLIISLFVGSAFLVVAIFPQSQDIIENIKKYRYIKTLVISTSISFLAMITFGIIGYPYVNETWSKYIIIAFIICIVASILINLILHTLEQFKNNKEIQNEHVLQFDYSRIHLKNYIAINTFYNDLLSFREEGLRFNPFELIIPYDKINFIIEADILRYTVYNRLIIKLSKEETSNIINKAQDYQSQNEFNADYINYLLESTIEDNIFELSIYLNYDVYYHLHKHDIKIIDLEQMVEDTNKVINDLPIKKEVNYDYQYSYGLIRPRPATIKEGFCIKKDNFWINCSLEKINNLLKYIIEEPKQTTSFIISTPCTYTEEKKFNTPGKLHNKIYAIDEISPYQLQTICDLYEDFLLNESFITIEIMIFNQARIMITPCKTIIINTKNKKLFKKYLEENGIKYNPRLKIIESYSLYSERRNYEINDHSIDKFVEDLMRFGLYYKCTDEVNVN